MMGVPGVMTMRFRLTHIALGMGSGKFDVAARRTGPHRTETGSFLETSSAGSRLVVETEHETRPEMRGI
jgi:hypothetical protein